MAPHASEDTGPVWDDGPWAPLPRLRTTVEADVCVVGLGGSGLSAVGELLDLGHSVVGVDAGPVAGGAAGRNGGFLLAGTPDFHHRAAAVMGADAAAALYRLTLDQLERIWVETPQAVRRTGSVRLAVDQLEIEDCRLQMEAMQAASLPVEVYAGPEGYGLRFPLDASSHPLRRCRWLAQKARMRRARLYEHSPAVDISGGRVRTPAGEVRCGAVVVAVDGRLEKVLPELKGRVRTARAQMLATGPAHGVTIPQPMYARWGYDYWKQTADKRVVIGGVRDSGGEGEWTDSVRPTAAIQSQLELILRTGLGVHAPITHRWSGSIAFTDDKLPIFAEVRDRVWAVGAYSGTGNVLGAVCGRAAAQKAVGATCLLDGIVDVGVRARARASASSA